VRELEVLVDQAEARAGARVEASEAASAALEGAASVAAEAAAVQVCALYLYILYI